jgi:hypothetical protein
MIRHATASAIILCCLVSTSAAHAGDPCTEGQLVSSYVDDGTLYLRWTGTVRNDMGKRINGEFDRVMARVKTVELALSSCGGRADAEKRTIDVLKRIKNTHLFSTVVLHGDLCASACVPIFLEGSRRIAALTSS